MLAMSTARPRPRLETSVRLRRGVLERRLRVAILSPMSEPDRIAPQRVLDAFVAGVNAGLFGRAAVATSARDVRLLADHGLVSDVLDAKIAGMPAHKLSALPVMVRASVRGAVRLEVHEDAPDERILLVRSLDRDTDATIVDIAWQLSFEPAEAPCLSVTFADEPPEDAVQRTTHVLSVWAEIVGLGAFPPVDGAAPGLVLREIAVRGPREVVACFEQLSCGYDAFEALFGALNRIHEEAPIERLTIGDRKN